MVLYNNVYELTIVIVYCKFIKYNGKQSLSLYSLFINFILNKQNAITELENKYTICN